MNIVTYADLYRFSFQVIITSENPTNCLFLTKRIKEYLSAWSFSVNLYAEDKSARVGAILQRGLRATMEDSGSYIIAFREGLRCICLYYDSFQENSTIVIHDGGTELVDARNELPLK